jgi:hypothetical protein
MIKSSILSSWLSSSVTESVDKRYRHQLLKEKTEYRSAMVVELKALVQIAHQDAICHLRRVAGISLDPLRPKVIDPTIGYPRQLDAITLKGYFGEIFAGMIAENCSPFGEDAWEIPAFLFRFHNVAFDQLERWHQAKTDPGIIPGRTGDDCLAFKRDEQGRIIRSLVCEAKCTKDHRSKLIEEAHEKVSEANSNPVNLRLVIEILMDRNDPISLQWVEGLRRLWLDESNTDCERYDLVSYVCGQHPIRNPSGWIAADKPHAAYTAGRRLEAVEVHLDKVDDLIDEVYGRKVY